MRRRVAIVCVVCAIATLPACRREEPPPPPDRTLEKLRAEVDRANAGGAVITSPQVPQDPNQNLAALAAGIGSGERGREGPLPLPSEGTATSAGPLSLRLVGLEAQHQLTARSMTLTSEALFLRVTMQARNTGAAPVHLTIDRAQVVASEDVFRVARDAQILAGTRELGFDLNPGADREVVLLFEVPPSALSSPELVLSLPHPEGGNGDVRLRLK